MKPDLTIIAGGPDGLAPGDETDSAPSKNEQCVPLDALAMPDQGEQMTNPEVGDPVSYQVEGKVTRVDANMAYVTVETINGKPVDKSGDEAAAAPADDAAPAEDANAFASLQDDAQKQGNLP